VRNIETNPHVSLVIDDYSEDWAELQWVLITGLAAIILPSRAAPDHARAVALLRDKYPQYHSMAIDERMIIGITPTRVRRWSGR
jgi:PPOX class probable F420-dependent enzyme